MSEAKTLKTIEQDMQSGSELQRIDALLDAFDYGDAGLDLIVQALDDPSQSVREAAYLLLTENQSERAKQALWDYLPYRHLQQLCTLHFLPDYADYDYWYRYYGEPEKTPVAYRYWNWQTLNYVAFTPDERTLITYTDQERRTYLWNYRTGELQDELSVVNWEDGGHLVLSPNGSYVISNNQYLLEGHPLKRGVDEFFYPLESEPTALAIKSEYILIAGGRGITSYDIEPIYVYQLPITDRAFNPTWDQNWADHYLRGHTSRVQSLLLSPDEALLLSQERDRQNDSHHLWDTRTWELLRTYETSSQWVADCLATRPDGQVLASGDRNHAATVWDLRTDEVLDVLPGKAPTVMSADGRVLICRGELGGLLVWDLATNQKICTLAEGIHKIEPLALSRDRQFLVIRVNDRVQVWA